MLWVELSVNKSKENGGCSHSFDSRVHYIINIYMVLEKLH